MEIDQLVDENYLRAILETFPIPVLIVDTGLTIHDANHASRKLLGDDISAKMKQWHRFAHFAVKSEMTQTIGRKLNTISQNTQLSDSVTASVPIVEKSITRNF
ncbi:PAS domain-containing protein [Desulfosarcina sp.]|uniref:PAS domain-containing protein n=1 Tax=Desulfosarcina sp. TaxID=2027861 RepID=UPI00299FF81F|nr:PAS domain-containing protein [Desulfosarcina sp.]MDX2453577.1 PAS domain-containing protein [Desulfosarcina sp.]MDX2491284.1 PAS domain-containing protein [Desulfosarcina sp.]